jgi:hypothetical protein
MHNNTHVSMHTQALAASLENMKSGTSQASENEIKKEDQNLALLNSLLGHLGGDPVHTYAVNDKEKNGGGQKVADGDETDGDRDTNLYVERLRVEDGAQQAVLQLLSRALGEVIYVCMYI